MQNLIYLIGFMGSGKSTTGKKLANELGYTFLDLDSMIENKYRISIPSIFSRFDENAFRKIEQETLKQTFDKKKHVIATGGGTPCFFNNLELINKNGISIYLKMTPEALHERLIKSRKKRPLIEQTQPDKILDYIKEQLWNRDFFYNKATYTAMGEEIEVTKLAKMIQSEINE